MPGHLVSFIDARRILPQKRAQRYHIDPIAIAPSGMPGDIPPEPWLVSTSGDAVESVVFAFQHKESFLQTASGM